MSDSNEVTLVHEHRKPNEVTTSKPATITQLKSQGYRVKSDGEPSRYETSRAADLKAEIDRRNADRDEDSKIVPVGRKGSDYAAALEADDAAQAEAEQPQGDEA